MRRNITYFWGDNNLLITLGNRTSFRIRAIYFIEFLVTTGMATVFLVQSLPLRFSAFHMLAGMGASTLYLLAAHRLLARIFFNEQLFLDKASLTLIRKTLFSRHIRTFEWKHVGMLHYQGKATKTDHPLKGKCFDYFGFDTQEQVIQAIHHEGNLYFDSPLGKVYFASGVYSWNAEEMVQMMKLFIGTSLKLGPEWKEMLQEQEFDEGLFS
jgi:hypothetical protein